MEKLLKSIKELNTLLKFIKQIKDNPLVPSPKMPGVKKLGSIKTQKITKIPGIAPNTLKDPNKVAQQFKNPAPKKPKMEILKTTSNGQWDLIEKAVWEHTPHIKQQDCKCSGASRGDNMHHYSCVDANPKPAAETARPNIDIKHDMSPKLKDAIDKFNKNVNVGHIKWDHDDGHAYSYIDHDYGDCDSHDLDEKDANTYQDAITEWLHENEGRNAIDCAQGAP